MKNEETQIKFECNIFEVTKYFTLNLCIYGRRIKHFLQSKSFCLRLWKKFNCFLLFKIGIIIKI